MVRHRVLVLLLILGTIILAGRQVAAQAPPTDDEFLQLVSQSQGIPRERLRIGDRVQVYFPLTDVLIYTAKVLDMQSGKGYLGALDSQHNPVDVTAAAHAEEHARKNRYGKIDPRLFAKLENLPPDQTIAVVLWLKAPGLAPNRALGLAQQLASLEQVLAPIKQHVLDQLNNMQVRASAAKYGAVIFASLTRRQIEDIAADSNVIQVFGPAEYRPANDSSGTTGQAYSVWMEGNTGGGTGKPIVLDPGGVSDLNPYLNNTAHTIQYWCASVSSTCPNGKNISSHASELAGIVASTHPLYRGVAPSVQIIISANTQNFSDENVVQAFEWGRGNSGNPTVVSWGTECGGYQTFLSRYLDWAVPNLFATIVTAAGNHPTFCPDSIADEKVAAPGVAWNVITVGSLNDNNTGFWSDDTMSGFSDWRNPDFAPGLEKPEVIAVGEPIRTTAATGDWLTPGSISGTSYATAQVAGQVSLMLGRQPGQDIWPETNKAAVLAAAFRDLKEGRDVDGVGASIASISDDTYRLGRFLNDSSAGSPLQISDFPRQHLDAVNLQAGQRVRVAIAWDSVSNGSSSDTLGADLDLCVRHPNNQTIVACSVSYQNAWELVEFTAPATGQYDVLVDLAGVDPGWPGTFLGVAWSIEAQRTMCSGAIDVPAAGGTFSIDTRNGPTFFEGYDGWARDQSGRERVLRLTLAEQQDLWIADTNPDLDLHLMQFTSCNSDPIVPTIIGSGTDSLAINAAAPGTYYLVVDGANGAVGQTSLTVSDRPPPATPSGLSASAGDGQVSLSWTAVSGADSYSVKRSTTSGGPYTTLTSVTDPAYTDSSVANGTTYYYVVSAVNTTGESANSNEVTATPQAPAGVPIKAMTFEDGSLEGPSGADLIKGTVQLESAAPLEGAYSARLPNVEVSYLQEDFAGVDELYTSFYIKLYALPSSNVRIALIKNSGTALGNIRLRPSGRLQLRVGSSVIGAESPPLAVGTVYRVGLVQKRGSGNNAVLQGYLAEGDASFGTPFAETTSGAWTSQANQLRVGATNSNLINAVFDNIKLDAAVMP